MKKEADPSLYVSACTLPSNPSFIIATYLSLQDEKKEKIHVKLHHELEQGVVEEESSCQASFHSVDFAFFVDSLPIASSTKLFWATKIPASRPAAL